MNSTPQSSSQWGASYRLVAAERWKTQSAAMGRDATNALVEFSRVMTGMSVLDLAAGTGEPGISMAQRVGSKGQVTAVDQSQELLDIAAERARQRGLTNFFTHQADAHALPFGANTFDVAACRFGVMFFSDAPKALGELRRVLKPGARACFLVWGRFEQPFFLPMSIVAKHVGGPALAPGGPNPFRYAQPGSLSAVLRETGFSSVEEERRAVPWAWPGTVEDFWEYERSVSAPFRPLLERVPEHKWPQINADVHASLRKYVEGESVQLGAVVILASGTKPQATR
jgi:SAM-dependent methyltransferase